MERVMCSFRSVQVISFCCYVSKRSRRCKLPWFVQTEDLSGKSFCKLTVDIRCSARHSCSLRYRLPTHLQGEDARQGVQRGRQLHRRRDAHGQPAAHRLLVRHSKVKLGQNKSCQRTVGQFVQVGEWVQTASVIH